MKRLLIRIEGSTHPPFKLKIRPDTTSRDVLSHLKLDEDYVLSPLSDPNKHFSPEEDLHGLLKNDEKLIARISPEAARRDLMMLVEVDDE